MSIKDHYKTLQVPQHATVSEIKKAYRILAQQYHPDKNNDDPYAAAQFAEIKEAYETLTNPAKKHEYLQERWYQKATGNSSVKETVTPVSILKKIIDFERYCSQLDVFRMNKAVLFEQMDELLNIENMQVLKRFNEEQINNDIAKVLIKPLALLSSRHAMLIVEKLKTLLVKNTSLLTELDTVIAGLQRKEMRQQFKWVWIVLLTIALCFLIELASRNN